MSTKTISTTALITGASTGIGATYADRLARRGHNVILVARDKNRMETSAQRLREETGVSIEVFPADLTNPTELARVEARLRDDSNIGILINNAGAGLPGGFLDSDIDAHEQIVRLNVVSVMRLACAVLPRFVKQGSGALINITSVLSVAPEVLPGVYSATKSFVLTFSQSLQKEVGDRGVYVQAVLPSATRTEIWERAGIDPTSIPGMMDVGELVDAALVGFDRRELISLPSLPDLAQWENFQKARLAMLPNFRQEHPAARYRS